MILQPETEVKEAPANQNFSVKSQHYLIIMILQPETDVIMACANQKLWFCFLFSRLQLLPPVSAAASGHFDAPPASPLWSFCGTPVPTPVWQCFQLGCRIRFLLPNTETPWQKAEVLALKDHEAMKIDSRNSYQYAPNGLVLVQVRNVCNVHWRPSIRS